MKVDIDISKDTNYGFSLTKEQLPELRKVLNRAMNTWDPQDQPLWLESWSDFVDEELAK